MLRSARGAPSPPKREAGGVAGPSPFLPLQSLDTRGSHPKDPEIEDLLQQPTTARLTYPGRSIN